MSLPLITFVSGVSGVLVVMMFLLIMVTMGSKLAISLDKKKEPAKQN